MEYISLFKNFTKEIGSQTLAQIIDEIRGDHYKEPISKIRELVDLGDQEKVNRLKKGLVAFTVSGLFEGGRKMSFLKTYNPFVILDIDKLDPEILPDLVLKIKAIEFTRAAFISPSGRGLKIIVEVNSKMEMHGIAYRQVMGFYEEVLAVEIDKSGKDITRLCFMSHDPEVYFNEESTVFSVLKLEINGSQVSISQKDPIPGRAPDFSNKEVDLTIDYPQAFATCVTQANAKLVYQKGNRNNYIYQLGVICSSAGIPVEVVINESNRAFDLSKIEIERTIKSAYNWKPYEPKKMYTELPTEAPSAIPSHVFDKLPVLLKEGCNVLKDRRERDVFLSGALGVLSGCLPGVSGFYDGHLCYPNLFVFVIAPAASGKGALKFAKCLGGAYHEELLALSKKEKVDYNKALLKFEKENTRYKKGKSESPPTAPEELSFKTLFIPANSSSAMLIRHLKQNDNSGILFESEADTLGNVLKQDWGGYSDLLRKAYHHESISYSRKSNSDFIEIAQPRLSVALSGTPGQVTSLIPSAEDGLFSRFMFYAFEVDAIWRDVSPEGRSKDFSDFYQDLSKEVLKMVHFLKANKTQFDLTKAQWRKVNQVFKKMMEKTNKDFGKEALSIVKRMGLICFRITMILSATRKFEEKNQGTDLVCNEDDFEVAICLVEIYWRHSVFVYDRLPRYNGNKFQFNNLKKQLFYNALPPKFQRREALQISKELKISERTTDRYLKNLIEMEILGQSPMDTFGEYFKV